MTIGSLIIALCVIALRMAFAIAAGWLALRIAFPLAFESYADGVQLTLLAALLVRLCVPRKGDA